MRRKCKSKTGAWQPRVISNKTRTRSKSTLAVRQAKRDAARYEQAA